MANDRPDTLRISPALLALLALAYLIPGLVGHDPWKSDDAIGIGIVHQMLEHGQWLLPNLSGEPYFNDGPFTYWIAALTAQLFGTVLPVHDSARLASGLLLAAAFWFVYLAAGEFRGRSADSDGIERKGAVLALIGCLGLLIHAHEMLAELGALAGLALAWYAIALAQRVLLRAGILLGLGIAIVILSKGPAMAAAPAAVALLAPAISSAWRRRAYALTLIAAVLVVAAAVGGWTMLAEYRNAPIALWWQNALSLLSVPGGSSALGWAKLLIWTSCPAWPIAFWALWERRRKSFEPGMRLLIVAVFVSLATLPARSAADEPAALPLLLPLALIAGEGFASLRRGAGNALMWFSIMSAAFFGALFWLGWFAMMTGMPQAIARSFTRLEPGFVPHFSAIGFVPAVTLTLAWLWLGFKSERTVLRGIVLWSSGIALMWALLTTLWLPWVDYGKSYRGVASSLMKVLPSDSRCIASLGFGPAQRGIFDYHADIVTERLERHPEARCALLLVQARQGDDENIGPGWKLLWEGRRPRDQERYRLYRKQS